ncbi:MAG: alpha-glucan family phosphorylase [Thermodesulfobacteriota bacterium]|nr:MAG: alpha-glucan family phosphorylase [Thermodesulfobacteriota bacterium]
MEELQRVAEDPQIAYFSMEIGLTDEIRTFSGGLGILAGDTLKSAAELNIPMIAVTLASRKGFFRQHLDAEGRQTEEPDDWGLEEKLQPIPRKVHVRIEGRDVAVRAWCYKVACPVTDWKVPIFYLDTNLPENDELDRGLTDCLYGGDKRYRLKQEIILGIGGVLMLNALGFRVKKYHMNEGHAAFLTLELLRRFKRDIESVWDEKEVWDFERVKNLCVFTTHTPVEAGHDRFPYDMVKEVIGEFIPLDVLKELAGSDDLNMTLLAMNLSKYINGVAKKHGEVSRGLFPGYEIKAITNGVHSHTWTYKSFARLYDRYLPGWANEPELFVRVDKIPADEIWDAHMDAKKELIDCVNEKTGVGMDYDTLTMGFARRATSYKRANMLFSDIERLKRIGGGKLQIIYAGKAHPRDSEGKRIIEDIFRKIAELKGSVKAVFLENYNIDLAKKLVSGVDVWLNTPMRPREASGTSGMKAAHNGVLNFSVLDGWWLEGHIEGYTGWSIGPGQAESVLSHGTSDVEDLYGKLEKEIIPIYYENRGLWIKMMESAIGKIAYYFNSHRMMRRYVTEAYIR